MAAWLGTLTAHLHQRIDISDGRVSDTGISDEGVDVVVTAPPRPRCPRS